MRKFIGNAALAVGTLYVLVVSIIIFTPWLMGDTITIEEQGFSLLSGLIQAAFFAIPLICGTISACMKEGSIWFGSGIGFFKKIYATTNNAKFTLSLIFPICIFITGSLPVRATMSTDTWFGWSIIITLILAGMLGASAAIDTSKKAAE